VKTGIKVSIPTFSQNLIVEGDERGGYYFAINDSITTPVEAPAIEVKSIGILWDSSLYVLFTSHFSFLSLVPEKILQVDL
jgi:hypothetical protein